MPERASTRHSGSFVLRIWWEQVEKQPAWRGWVQHAASGDSSYFYNLADLLDFVETRTGVLSNAAPAKEAGEEIAPR